MSISASSWFHPEPGLLGWASPPFSLPCVTQRVISGEWGVLVPLSKEWAWCFTPCASKDSYYSIPFLHLWQFWQSLARVSSLLKFIPIAAVGLSIQPFPAPEPNAGIAAPARVLPLSWEVPLCIPNVPAWLPLSTDFLMKLPILSMASFHDTSQGGRILQLPVSLLFGSFALYQRQNVLWMTTASGDSNTGCMYQILFPLQVLC